MKRQNISRPIAKHLAAVALMLGVVQSGAVRQSLGNFAGRAQAQVSDAMRPTLLAVATFTGNHELYRRASRLCAGSQSANAAGTPVASVATPSMVSPSTISPAHVSHVTWATRRGQGPATSARPTRAIATSRMRFATLQRAALADAGQASHMVFLSSDWEHQMAKQQSELGRLRAERMEREVMRNVRVVMMHPPAPAARELELPLPRERIDRLIG